MKIKITGCMKKSLIKVPVAVALVAQMFGCQRTVTPGEYQTYYEKNNKKFSTEIVRNGMCARLSYCPNELYAARDLVADTILPVDSALKRYKHSLFFLLTLSMTSDAGPFARFQDERVKQMVKDAAPYSEKDVYLIVKDDTVPVTACTQLQNKGAGNENGHILIFPRHKLKTQLEKYSLIARTISPELGTIECRLDRIVKKTPKLRG